MSAPGHNSVPYPRYKRCSNVLKCLYTNLRGAWGNFKIKEQWMSSDGAYYLMHLIF